MGCKRRTEDSKGQALCTGLVCMGWRLLCSLRRARDFGAVAQGMCQRAQLREQQECGETRDEKAVEHGAAGGIGCGL